MSFVLVSPSTVIWLNELSTASRRARRRNDGATAASVVMNPSIVAMFGWIIPEPLHMPPMRTVRPPRSTSAWAVFGTVSVVMIARAAASPDCALRLPHAWAIPGLIASMGR